MNLIKMFKKLYEKMETITRNFEARPGSTNPEVGQVPQQQPKTQMNILVTGGAGFIGSHLADQLVTLGHNVVIVDNLSTGRIQNVPIGVSVFTLDISDDISRVEELFKRVQFDYVFHLAAAARIGWCLENPAKSHDINATATLNLLELSRRNGVKGFIFSSTSSVYGEVDQEIPITEDTPINPITLYGLQKFTAERYVKFYHQYFGLPTVALRYFNVYGSSRQNPAGAYANVFSSFKRDMDAKGEITIHGTGEQRRDFIHVYDVVAANTFFIENPKYLKGGSFNVGTGVATSISEIADFFPTTREYADPRPGDPVYSCANNRKLRSLGWKPRVDLESGVDIFFKSFNNGDYD